MNAPKMSLVTDSGPPYFGGQHPQRDEYSSPPRSPREFRGNKQHFFDEFALSPINEGTSRTTCERRAEDITLSPYSSPLRQRLPQFLTSPRHRPWTSTTARRRAARDGLSDVRLLLRIRPRLDIENPSAITFKTNDEKTCLTLQKEVKKISTTGTFTEQSDYSFQRIFTPEDNSDEVYEVVGPAVLDSLKAGCNTTLLAYGQTGSGKTFTMSTVSRFIMDDIFGAEGDGAFLDAKVDVSIVQIYMDNPFDLLQVSPQYPKGFPIDKTMRTAKRFQVLTAEESCYVMAKAEYSRSKVSHALNKLSSRSHSIVTFTIAMPGKELVKLILVDLAGSERVEQTQTIGEAFREGKAINTSLLALSRCIQAMGSSTDYLPFRENALTQFLADSFSGGGTLQLLCCISNTETSIIESKNTLAFADIAKRVKLSQHGRVALKPLVNNIESRQCKALRLLEEEHQLAIAALTTENSVLSREMKVLRGMINEEKKKHGEKEITWTNEFIATELLAMGSLGEKGTPVGGGGLNENARRFAERVDADLLSQTGATKDINVKSVIEALVAENIRLRNTINDVQIQIDSLILERKIYQEQISDMMDLITDTEREQMEIQGENKLPQSPSHNFNKSTADMSEDFTTSTSKRFNLTWDALERSVASLSTLDITSPQLVVGGPTANWNAFKEKTASGDFTADGIYSDGGSPQDLVVPEAILRAIILRSENERKGLAKRIAELEAKLDFEATGRLSWDVKDVAGRSTASPDSLPNDTGRASSPNGPLSVKSLKNPGSSLKEFSLESEELLRQKSSKYLSVAARRSQICYDNPPSSICCQTEDPAVVLSELETCLQALRIEKSTLSADKKVLKQQFDKQNDMLDQLNLDNKQLRVALLKAFKDAENALGHQSMFVNAICRKTRSTSLFPTNGECRRNSMELLPSQSRGISTDSEAMKESVSTAKDIVLGLKMKLGDIQQNLLAPSELTDFEFQRRKIIEENEMHEFQQSMMAHYRIVTENAQKQMKRAKMEVAGMRYVLEERMRLTEADGFESKKSESPELEIAQNVNTPISFRNRKEDPFVLPFLVATLPTDIGKFSSESFTKAIAALSHLSLQSIEIIHMFGALNICFRANVTYNEEKKYQELLTLLSKGFNDDKFNVTFTRWGTIEDLLQPRATLQQQLLQQEQQSLAFVKDDHHDQFTASNSSSSSPSIRRAAFFVAGGSKGRVNRQRIDELESELTKLEKELEVTKLSILIAQSSSLEKTIEEEENAAVGRKRDIDNNYVISPVIPFCRSHVKDNIEEFSKFIVCTLPLPTDEVFEMRFATDLSDIYGLSLENIDVLHLFAAEEVARHTTNICIRFINCDEPDERLEAIISDFEYDAEGFADLSIIGVRWGDLADLQKPRVFAGRKSLGNSNNKRISSSKSDRLSRLISKEFGTQVSRRSSSCSKNRTMSAEHLGHVKQESDEGISAPMTGVAKEAMELLEKLKHSRMHHKQLLNALDLTADELERLRHDTDVMLSMSPLRSPERVQHTHSPLISVDVAAAVRYNSSEKQSQEQQQKQKPEEEDQQQNEMGKYKQKEVVKTAPIHAVHLTAETEKQRKIEQLEALLKERCNAIAEQERNIMQLRLQLSLKDAHLAATVQCDNQELNSKNVCSHKIAELEGQLERLQTKLDSQKRERNTSLKRDKSKNSEEKSNDVLLDNDNNKSIHSAEDSDYALTHGDTVSSARELLDKLKDSRDNKFNLLKQLDKAVDELEFLRNNTGITTAGSRSPLRNMSVQSLCVAAENSGTQSAVTAADGENTTVFYRKSASVVDIKSAEAIVDAKKAKLVEQELEMVALRVQLQKKLSLASLTLSEDDAKTDEIEDTLENVGINPFVVLETENPADEFYDDEFLLDVAKRIGIAPQSEYIEIIHIFGNTNVCIRFAPSTTGEDNNKRIIHEFMNHPERYLAIEITSIRWGTLRDLQQLTVHTIGAKEEEMRQLARESSLSNHRRPVVTKNLNPHFKDIMNTVYDKVEKDVLAPSSPHICPETNLPLEGLDDSTKALLAELKKYSDKKQRLLSVLNATADEIERLKKCIGVKSVSGVSTCMSQQAGNGEEDEDVEIVEVQPVKASFAGIKQLFQLDAELTDRSQELAKQQHEIAQSCAELKVQSACNGKSSDVLPYQRRAAEAAQSEDLIRLNDIEALLTLVQDKLNDERCCSSGELTDIVTPTVKAVATARRLLDDLRVVRSQKLAILDHLDESSNNVEQIKRNIAITRTSQQPDAADRILVLTAKLEEAQKFVDNDEKLQAVSVDRITILEQQLQQLENERLRLASLSLSPDVRAGSVLRKTQLVLEEGVVSAAFMTELERTVIRKDEIISELTAMLGIQRTAAAATTAQLEAHKKKSFKDMLSEMRRRVNDDTMSPCAVKRVVKDLFKVTKNKEASYPPDVRGLIEQLKASRDKRLQLLRGLDTTADEIERIKRNIKGPGGEKEERPSAVLNEMMMIRLSALNHITAGQKKTRLAEKLEAVADELDCLKKGIKGMPPDKLEGCSADLMDFAGGRKHDKTEQNDEEEVYGVNPIGEALNINARTMGGRSVAGDLALTADELGKLRKGIKGIQPCHDANVEVELEKSDEDYEVSLSNFPLKNGKKLGKELEATANELDHLRRDIKKVSLDKSGHAIGVSVEEIGGEEYDEHQFNLPSLAFKNGKNMAGELIYTADELDRLRKGIKGVHPSGKIVSHDAGVNFNTKRESRKDDDTPSSPTDSALALVAKSRKNRHLAGELTSTAREVELIKMGITGVNPYQGALDLLKHSSRKPHIVEEHEMTSNELGFVAFGIQGIKSSFASGTSSSLYITGDGGNVTLPFDPEKVMRLQNDLIRNSIGVALEEKIIVELCQQLAARLGSDICIQDIINPNNVNKVDALSKLLKTIEEKLGSKTGIRGSNAFIELELSDMDEEDDMILSIQNVASARKLLEEIQAARENKIFLFDKLNRAIMDLEQLRNIKGSTDINSEVYERILSETEGKIRKGVEDLAKQERLIAELRSQLREKLYLLNEFSPENDKKNANMYPLTLKELEAMEDRLKELQAENCSLKACLEVADIDLADPKWRSHLDRLKSAVREDIDLNNDSFIKSTPHKPASTNTSDGVNVTDAPQPKIRTYDDKPLKAVDTSPPEVICLKYADNREVEIELDDDEVKASPPLSCPKQISEFDVELMKFEQRKKPKRRGRMSAVDVEVQTILLDMHLKQRESSQLTLMGIPLIEKRQNLINKLNDILVDFEDLRKRTNVVKQQQKRSTNLSQGSDVTRSTSALPPEKQLDDLTILCKKLKDELMKMNKEDIENENQNVDDILKRFADLEKDVADRDAIIEELSSLMKQHDELLAELQNEDDDEYVRSASPAARDPQIHAALEAALVRLQEENIQQKQELAKLTGRVQKSISVNGHTGGGKCNSQERVFVQVVPGNEKFTTGFIPETDCHSIDMREICVPPFAVMSVAIPAAEFNEEAFVKELAMLAGVTDKNVDLMHISGVDASTDVCFRFVNCTDVDGKLMQIICASPFLQNQSPEVQSTMCHWGTIDDLRRPGTTKHFGSNIFPSTVSWLQEIGTGSVKSKQGSVKASVRSGVSNDTNEKLLGRIKELEAKLTFSSADGEGLCAALSVRCDEALGENTLNKERRNRIEKKLTELKDAYSELQYHADDLQDRLNVQKNISKNLAAELNAERLNVRNAGSDTIKVKRRSTVSRSHTNSTISNAALMAHIEELLEKICTLSEQNFDLMMEVEDSNYSHELHISLSTIRSENRRLIKIMQHYGVPVVASYDASTDAGIRVLQGKVGNLVGGVNIGVNTDAINLIRNMPAKLSSEERIQSLNALIIDKDKMIDSLWIQNDELTRAAMLSGRKHAGSPPSALKTSVPLKTNEESKKIRMLECEIAYLQQQKGYNVNTETPLLARRVVELEDELAELRQGDGAAAIPSRELDGVERAQQTLNANLKREVETLRYELQKSTELIVKERRAHHDNTIMLSRMQVKNIEIHMVLIKERERNDQLINLIKDNRKDIKKLSTHNIFMENGKKVMPEPVLDTLDLMKNKMKEPMQDGKTNEEKKKSLEKNEKNKYGKTKQDINANVMERMPKMTSNDFALQELTEKDDTLEKQESEIIKKTYQKEEIPQPDAVPVNTTPLTQKRNTQDPLNATLPLQQKKSSFIAALPPLTLKPLDVEIERPGGELSIPNIEIKTSQLVIFTDDSSNKPRFNSAALTSGSKDSYNSEQLKEIPVTARFTGLGVRPEKKAVSAPDIVAAIEVNPSTTGTRNISAEGDDSTVEVSIETTDSITPIHETKNLLRESDQVMIKVNNNYQDLTKEMFGNNTTEKNNLPDSQCRGTQTRVTSVFLSKLSDKVVIYNNNATPQDSTAPPSQKSSIARKASFSAYNVANVSKSSSFIGSFTRELSIVDMYDEVSPSPKLGGWVPSEDRQAIPVKVLETGNNEWALISELEDVIHDQLDTIKDLLVVIEEEKGCDYDISKARDVQMRARELMDMLSGKDGGCSVKVRELKASLDEQYEILRDLVQLL